VPRTRDEDARRRVLNAARDLVSELGPRAVTVDQIAAAAGVGKQTIYRWWPSRGAVVMDALIELTDPEPGELPEAVHDALRLQMRRVGRMFASRPGQLIREVVADAQGDPELAEDFRQRFFAHRRARAAATIERGIASGELRPDIDIDDALDLLSGPLWLRLLIGHRACTPRAVDELFTLVWPVLANGATPT